MFIHPYMFIHTHTTACRDRRTAMCVHTRTEIRCGGLPIHIRSVRVYKLLLPQLALLTDRSSPGRAGQSQPRPRPLPAPAPRTPRPPRGAGAPQQLRRPGEGWREVGMEGQAAAEPAGSRAAGEPRPGGMCPTPAGQLCQEWRCLKPCNAPHSAAAPAAV